MQQPDPSVHCMREVMQDRFRLEELLGEGAMSQVFRAQDLQLRRSVVLKIMRVGRTNDVHGRMYREARILSTLRHPSLVVVHDFVQPREGPPFIVMEYLEGRTLRALLRERGPLPPAMACRFAAEALEGLHAAHEAKVIHRDIKPENLFVTSDEHIKVLDFGLAKPLGNIHATGPQTADGRVLGTPRYMAPEQAKDEALSPATDLYALGCVLFEMLTGTPLFAFVDAQAQFHAHVCTSPPALSARAMRTFSPALEAFVAKLLTKAPQRRPASALDAARIARCLAVDDELAAPSPAPDSAVGPLASLPRTPTEPLQPVAPAVGHALALPSPHPPSPAYRMPSRIPMADTAAELHQEPLAKTLPEATSPSTAPPPRHSAIVPARKQKVAPGTAHASTPPRAEHAPARHIRSIILFAVAAALLGALFASALLFRASLLAHQDAAQEPWSRASRTRTDRDSPSRTPKPVHRLSQPLER